MERIKISVNKLGEYLTANPSRRKRIIKDQKEPKGYIIIRYREARKAIVDFFKKGRGDKAIIEKSIRDLIESTVHSSMMEQDRDLSIEALELFQASSISLDLENQKVISDSNVTTIDISGGTVSIFPDVIIHGQLNGKPFVGAIKLHFSKNNRLDIESGSYVATMLRMYLEGKYPNTKVNLKYCVAIDVFDSKAFYAPSSWKMRKKHLIDACEEIKLMWPHL